MYVNPHFRPDDPAALHEVVERHPFGLLLAARDGDLQAAHIPFVLHRDEGPRGTLEAHVAARDPIAGALDGRVEVMAVFSGPLAYVSPRWYEDPGLPTYNFVAVHAHGRPRPMAGEAEALAHLRELVDVHEAAFDPPWSLDQASDDYVRALLPGIAPFRLPIARLEGKLKLSQNRSAADRAGVVAGLRARGGDGGRAVAELMAGFPYGSDAARPLLPE